MSERLPASNGKRWLFCGLFATLVPVLLLLAFGIAAGSNESTAWAFAWYVVVGVGLTATWNLPLPLWAKPLACIVWAVTMLPLLFVVAVNFACFLHGACL